MTMDKVIPVSVFTSFTGDATTVVHKAVYTVVWVFYIHVLTIFMSNMYKISYCDDANGNMCVYF